MLYVLCLLFSLMLGVGQLLFKLAANHINNVQAGQDVFAFLSWQLILAVAVYGVTTVLWIYILTKLPLSTAYPFSLAGAAFVIILARAVFSEPISVKQLIGIGLIGIGLIFTVAFRSETV